MLCVLILATNRGLAYLPLEICQNDRESVGHGKTKAVLEERIHTHALGTLTVMKDFIWVHVM